MSNESQLQVDQRKIMFIPFHFQPTENDADSQEKGLKIHITVFLKYI